MINHPEKKDETLFSSYLYMYMGLFHHFRRFFDKNICIRIYLTFPFRSNNHVTMTCHIINKIIKFMNETSRRCNNDMLERMQVLKDFLKSIENSAKNSRLADVERV